MIKSLIITDNSVIILPGLKRIVYLIKSGLNPLFIFNFHRICEANAMKIEGLDAPRFWLIINLRSKYSA